MLYRSRRLEALLGGPLEAVTYSDLVALVDNTEASEAEDLDYKTELSANTDKGKEEFAKDVAGFANHIGGVIVVGMAEVKGIPSKVVDADVSDALRRHLQQVVASNTAPPVRFDMRAVPNPDPAADGRGFLLIAVQRSAHGPHAVTAPPTKATEKALRYPRRAASKTDWLTETDVATAYQRRFSEGTERSQRLKSVERSAVYRLPRNGLPCLLVTVVPETPGDMTINQEIFRQHQAELLTASLLGENDHVFDEVRIGSRRLIATGGDPHGTWYSQCNLYRDGSGVWAMRPATHTDSESEEEEPSFRWTEPDTVVWLLLSALHLLGVHARDRAGATGTALTRAVVIESRYSYPGGPDRPGPLAFMGNRPEYQLLYPLRIDGVHASFGTRTHLSTQTSSFAESEAVVFLDELADPGPGLTQAASFLADELVQAFGIPEAPPLTRAGQLRQSGWSRQLRPGMVRWAEAHGIEILSS
ncbi:helix-turn-helix domain-containing protein [Streptomyces sp. NPDC088197]|uniref:AlbA family DNA-binding domain-containing protein n=1 Tax=unclassified Streptomyces TaxID=2593676 RepID=UPI0036EF5720